MIVNPLNPSSMRSFLRIGFLVVALVIVGSGSSLFSQSQPQFVYVVNNNFRALIQGGGDVTPDPTQSLSTVTAWRVNADNSLTKVGTFSPPGGILPFTAAPGLPLGGVRAVWNTLSSWLSPARLAVNDYVGGPALYSINPVDGTLALIKSLPGPGNSGSSITYSNFVDTIYSGDYFGRTIRVLTGVETNATALQTTVTFPDQNWVVTVKVNPEQTRLVAAIDLEDPLGVAPSIVRVIDLKPGPNQYQELPGSPIQTGGISAAGGMAFAKDGRLVVANLGKSTLCVIDLTTMGLVSGLIPLTGDAKEPVEVVFHPDGTKLYVACRSGHVAGFSYTGSSVTELPGSPWATGSIETQNLVINYSGALLYALNSGDFTSLNPADHSSITGFTINAQGTLTKLNPLAPVSDSNFYPTGIGIYAPSPRFTAVSWTDKGPLVYGTLLSSAELNATSSAGGTIAYTEGSNPITIGTLLTTGTHSVTATFTPTPTTPASFIGSSATRTITIVKQVPAIKWDPPAPISCGTPLTAVQLNAASTAIIGGSAVTLPGTFTYNPPSGTTLNAGIQTLKVTFVPTDQSNFTTPVTKSVQITVNQSTPVISWNNPADIPYGTSLSSTQLNATAPAGVQGSFVYTPPAGTALPVGNGQTLSVVFTPTSTSCYTTASKTVKINVVKATPVATWNDPADIVFGTPLGGSQLNASASVGGAFVYNPAAGTVLSVGNGQILSVTFTPTDPNYNTVTKTVKINVLAKAPPTPQVEKKGILDSMKAVTGGTPNDKKRMERAIDAVQDSLAPSLWVDSSHLECQHGNKVFDREKYAVNALQEILKDKTSSLTGSVIQGFIDGLTRVDRDLANRAVSDANTVQGAKGEELNRAKMRYAQGNSQWTDGYPDKAIDRYKYAWKHALKAIGQNCGDDLDDHEDEDCKDDKGEKDDKSDKDK